MRFLLSHQAHTDFLFENSSPLVYHSRYIYIHRILHGFFDHSPRKSFNFWNAQLIPWITTLVIGFYIGAALGAGRWALGWPGHVRVVVVPTEQSYQPNWYTLLCTVNTGIHKFKTKFPPNLIVCHDSPC